MGPRAGGWTFFFSLYHRKPHVMSYGSAIIVWKASRTTPIQCSGISNCPKVPQDVFKRPQRLHLRVVSKIHNLPGDSSAHEIHLGRSGPFETPLSSRPPPIIRAGKLS